MTTHDEVFRRRLNRRDVLRTGAASAGARSLGGPLPVAGSAASRSRMAARRQGGDPLVQVGIRAENIEPATGPDDRALAVATEVVEPLGSHLWVTAAVGDQHLKLQTRTDFSVTPRAPLWLRPEPDRLRWFDPETSQEIPPG